MANSISDEEIKVAAYYLWEKEGRPEGVEFDLWVRAKNELAKKKDCKNGECSVKPASSEKEVKKVEAPKAQPSPAKNTATKSKKK